MREIVLVEWHDAHAGTDTWTHVEELKNDSLPYVVLSVGFLLRDGMGGKPDHVTIVQSWSDDDALDSVLHVPNKMVRRVVVLKGLKNEAGRQGGLSTKEGRRRDR